MAVAAPYGLGFGLSFGLGAGGGRLGVRVLICLLLGKCTWSAKSVFGYAGGGVSFLWGLGCCGWFFGVEWEGRREA